MVRAAAFPGLKARRWVEDWIRAHYPDKDVQILDCDVRTGRATICVEMGVCDGWGAGVCGGVSERAGSPFYDAARTAACPANSLVIMKRGRCRACGAGDVSDLLHYFYSFTSRNLAWKMIAYSRDVPVGTLRTVRGARARGT